jgi:hypothetical protein
MGIKPAFLQGRKIHLRNADIPASEFIGLGQSIYSPELEDMRIFIGIKIFDFERLEVPSSR